jgi:hypothetical protein
MLSICTNIYDNTRANGRIITNWNYEGVGWIKLTQDKDKWQKVMDTSKIRR